MTDKSATSQTCGVEGTFRFHSAQTTCEDIIGPHRQTTWELDYIHHGEGIHVFDETRETCHRGEIILVPPQVTHSWEFSRRSADSWGRIHTYTLFFDAPILAGRLNVFPELQFQTDFLSIIKHPVEITGTAAHAIRQLILRMEHEDAAARFTSFLQIVFLLNDSAHWRPITTATHSFHTGHAQTVIQKAYQYILDHYQEDVRLQDVAQLVCMNRSAFCTLFKHCYTQSFFHVLSEYRINAACLLLSDDKSLSIADIAHTTGFNDVPYFHRTFRRFKGCTPLAYRQALMDEATPSPERHVP